MRKHVQSARYINLKAISNDKEDGFLPTFGPIFLHLYNTNNFEEYAGTILMAMTTEVEELVYIENVQTSIVRPIPPLDEV